ncbi:MAG: hypothetical protein ABL961_05745 [Vicinamibacterales bacterium]
MLALPLDDERVRRCVISVQSQCHGLLMNPVATRVAPDFKADDAQIAAWTEHIAAFPLYGIRAAAMVPG